MEAVWRSAWGITDREGAPLVPHLRTASLAGSGPVELEEAGRRLPDLEPLVYMG